MPRKRIAGGKRKRRVHRKKKGGAWYDGIWNAAKKVGKFLGDTKIISTVASLIPHPAAQGVATGARAIGLGRSRQGKGWMNDVLSGVHKARKQVGVGKLTKSGMPRPRKMKMGMGPSSLSGRLYLN